MDDELLKRCVKCPSCGDVFTVKRGILQATADETNCPDHAQAEAERRNTGRAHTVSIRILHEDTLREFPVKDISTTSIGIYHLGWRFEVGSLIQFDIIEGYKFLLKGVKAKILRIDDEAIGGVFENVTPDDIAPIYAAALTRETAAGTMEPGA